MTFLSRPVLEIKPNWLRTPAVEYQYNLRGIRIGFGSATFGPTATHVARAWSLDFTFFTASEFAEFSAFTEARSGRMDGFWMPNVALQFKVISGISGIQFDIETQNLADTWNDDASEYLYGIRPDGTTVAAKIDTVSSPSAGVERITVAAFLGDTPTSDWRFYRLVYVRMVDDEERVIAHTEGVYGQQFKAVELPEEYAAAETGQKPAYLYDFFQDNGDSTFYHWRFTSSATDLISSGDTFFGFNINHGELSQSTKADHTEIEIKSVMGEDTPWALHFPFPSTRPLMLNVYEVDVTLPAIRKLYFSGECSDITADGTEITLNFDHWFDSLRSQFPGRSIQPRCYYHFGDPNTCKAVLSSYSNPDFQLSVTITAISGFEVSVSATKFGTHAGDYPLGFFATGWIRVGVEPTIEERMVVTSSAAAAGGVVLVVSQKIIHQTLPAIATLRRGCAQSYATCKSYGNQANYPGFVDVPRVNPTLKAIEIESGTAGKK